MKYNQIVFDGLTDEKGKIEIDLERYLPLNKVICNDITKVEYYFVNRWVELEKPYKFENVAARYINITAKKSSKINITLGKGFYGYEKENYSKQFKRRSGWTGGDGIFSFNIKDGNDSIYQEDAKTLFVFGDTFVGYVSEDYYRTEPLLMPNNSIAYLDGIDPTMNDISFQVNTNEYDTIVSYFEPDNCSIYSGTVPRNLVTYDEINIHNRYLSGYNPRKVQITFDLFNEKTVSKLELLNYFDEVSEKFNMSRRGIKEVEISYANEDKNFVHLKNHNFRKATSLQDYEVVEINQNLRYLRLNVTPTQGVGNHYEIDNTSEVVFGINKVKLFTAKRLLKDIHVQSSSIMSKEKPVSWFWLQDGVVVDDNLYFVPLLVGPDETQPEGLQFRVKDVSMIKVPIKNNMLDFNNAFQKPTPLAHASKESSWLFGAAFTANTKQAGAVNPDGYIYVYGYETIMFERLLKVARVKVETLDDFDTWEYYSDGKWVSEMTEASTLLNHVSCEMSVTPITTGEHKGKYIAIYTYDVNTTLIAYSIGDTPWGPFTNPIIAFESEEKEKLGGKAYTYNSKAHPHMSSSDELIVTYNVNTYSMKQNTSNANVYRPRFVGLKYIGE